jgi:hypothetical protein
VSKFEYFAPLSVGSAFLTEQDVALFIDFMLDELIELSNGKDDDFIPPIVYNAMGRVYNIEYNFIVKCLAKFLEDDAISGDFSLIENGSGGAVTKAALFLIVGIFEEYYELVRANNYKVDLGKYKSKGMIEVGRRFYNVLVMQNGNEVRRFSAVPFSENGVKNMLSADRIMMFDHIAKNENLRQIVFGNGKYKEYVASTNLVPEYVQI